MDTPNVPNPANPNKQESADQNQDQVPVGPAPPQGPVQASTTTSSYSTGACWCHAHSSDYLSKLDRQETRIFRYARRGCRIPSS